ncbi:hypothetical protein [Methanopyrus sp.]
MMVKRDERLLIEACNPWEFLETVEGVAGGPFAPRGNQEETSERRGGRLRREGPGDPGGER